MVHVKGYSRKANTVKPHERKKPTKARKSKKNNDDNRPITMEDFDEIKPLKISKKKEPKNNRFNFLFLSIHKDE